MSSPNTLSIPQISSCPPPTVTSLAHALKKANPKGHCDPAESDHYVNLEARNGLVSTLPNGDDTVWKSFVRSVRATGDAPCFGMRSHILSPEQNYVLSEQKIPKRGAFVWSTYAQVYNEVSTIAAALRALGCTAGEMICIFAANQPRWATTALACMAQSLVVVPISQAAEKASLQNICDQTQTRCVFVSKEKLPALLEALPRSPSPLTLVGDSSENAGKRFKVVVFDADRRWQNVGDRVTDEAIAQAQVQYNVQLVRYSDLLKDFTPQPLASEPKANELCYLIYTSGTTGAGKGAMKSHGNLVADIAASRMHVQPNDKDVYCSYLPLDHVFETCALYMAVSCSMRVGFASGNIKIINEDLQLLRPTIFCGVPKVFDSMRTHFTSALHKQWWIAQAAFNLALWRQTENVKVGQRKSWYDVLLNPVAVKMGLDRARVIVSGAAPMPADLMLFMRTITPAKVITGYGMTECGTVSAMQTDDVRLDHVGPPLACVEVKLVSEKEMHYSTDHVDAAGNPEPEGEVLIHGPGVFMGYYKNEKETRQTLVTDPVTKKVWVHSGDIGRMGADGTLQIIDRKKNMLKLANGEYVALERLESKYKIPAVAQLWVYGNAHRNNLMAVVVPEREALVQWLIQQKLWTPAQQALHYGSPEFSEALARAVQDNYKAVQKHYLSALHAAEALLASQNEPLKKHEILKDIIVEADLDDMGQGFRVANGLITPTMKLKRKPLLDKYLGRLQQLYAVNGEPSKPGEVWT